MAIVLITGGSGMIGRALTAALLRDGHTVRHLSRHDAPNGEVPTFRWNVRLGEVDARALEGVDHVVHLAGAPIVDRPWTADRVRELIDSRAASARLLLNAARAQGLEIRSMVSAAGIGYHGAVTTDRVFTEQDPPGTDTVARISGEWEEAVNEWASITRVVALRIPPVLAARGGALERFVRLGRWYLLAPLGSGRQWFPWVHCDDLVRAFVHALGTPSMQGAYHVAAAEQPTQRDFLRGVAHAMHRPLLPVPVPAWIVRMLLGERAAVVLEGGRVSSERLRATGFRHRFDALAPALADLLQ